MPRAKATAKKKESSSNNEGLTDEQIALRVNEAREHVQFAVSILKTLKPEHLHVAWLLEDILIYIDETPETWSEDRENSSDGADLLKKLDDIVNAR